MKVVIKGSSTLNRAKSNISEVINKAISTFNLPEGTKLKIEDLEFKVRFEIDGKETYASVPREVQGETVHEMLMVAVHVDKKGKIDYTETNENESFHDGYTLAQAVGKEYQYESIESAYENDDLEIIEYIQSNESDDKKVMAVKYRVKNEEDTEVIRHYKGDKLVFEYVIKNKEDKSE